MNKEEKYMMGEGTPPDASWDIRIVFLSGEIEEHRAPVLRISVIEDLGWIAAPAPSLRLDRTGGVAYFQGYADDKRAVYHEKEGTRPS